MAQQYDIAPMEGAQKAGEDPLGKVLLKTPNGQVIEYKSQALARQKDDFGVVPQTADEAEAAMRRELSIRPRCDSPCTVCGTVHVREGYPMCICLKCGHMGRIVHMGYCTACAYKKLSDIGANQADVDRMEIFAKYVAHTRKADLEKVTKNKEDWE